MRNGISFKIGALGVGRVLCVLCVLVCLVCLDACRSSRRSMETVRSETQTAVREAVAVESVGYTAATREECTDTVSFRADENSVYTISRDSAGRITEVASVRRTDVSSNGKGKRSGDFWFYGLNATRCSEASAEVDTVGEKAAEAASAAEVRVPLMVRVGWCLVVLVIIFYIGDYICRRWIERRKR